jgi:hypothetical protein
MDIGQPCIFVPIGVNRMKYGACFTIRWNSKKKRDVCCIYMNP